jgi:hypothetical protein
MTKAPPARKEAAGTCAACQTNADYFCCPNCNVVKEKQNTMYYHMSKCTGSTEHKCRHCTFVTVQKSALELHLQVRHPDEEEAATATKKREARACPWPDCPFKSVTVGNLRVHFVRIHLAAACGKIVDKDDDTYCCNACDKEFANATHFYYHAGPCLLQNKQVNRIQAKLLEKVLA